MFGGSSKVFSFLAFFAFAALTACSESRKALYSAAELSEVVFLPCFDEEEASEFECGMSRLNYDNNSIYFYIYNMPYTYDDESVPYRILARHQNSSEYVVIVPEIYDGQTIEATPPFGRIEDYQDWIIETAYNMYGLEWAEADLEEGIRLFDGTIIFNQSDTSANEFDPFAQ